MIELVMILCTERYAVSWPKCHRGEVTTEQIFRSRRLQCNLFAFHKSRLGYDPVDIGIVSYILCNVIYTVLGES